MYVYSLLATSFLGQLFANGGLGAFAALTQRRGAWTSPRRPSIIDVRKITVIDKEIFVIFITDDAPTGLRATAWGRGR